MEYKIFNGTAVLRVDKGEELIASLLKFQKEAGFRTAIVQGIGAVNHVEAGLFLTKEKRYVSQIKTGDMEIVSLEGNLSEKDGAPYAHLHIAVADQTGAVWGGHLNQATVSATAELTVQKINGSVDRTFSEEIGLNLFDFGKTFETV